MTLSSLFQPDISQRFSKKVLEIFHYQYTNVFIYQNYVNYLGINPKEVKLLENIPFLPIELFKKEVILDSISNHEYKSLISYTKPVNPNFDVLFSSSGTTGLNTSKHYVRSLELYEESFQNGFNQFYGDIKDYVLLALLPSYLERDGSSLIYMVQKLMERGHNLESGFYLDDLEGLRNQMEGLRERKQKTILIGVTYALLDFVEKFPDFWFPELIVMETGGMKGKRKEMVREELHQILNHAFKTSNIHSEYGMTELLSQAYSQGNGRFRCPPWMKVLIRETQDPFSYQEEGKAGGLNVVDLANIHSCSFIATQDLGKVYPDGSFEILGRFDHSDIRGCNLLMETGS